jgi:hypothetical protein
MIEAPGSSKVVYNDDFVFFRGAKIALCPPPKHYDQDDEDRDVVAELP